MKELLLVFLLALVVGSIINGCLRNTQEPATDPDRQASASQGAGHNATSRELPGLKPVAALVGDTSDTDFAHDVLSSGQPVLVDFWADWCGPCKEMAPVINELASQYQGRLTVLRLDVDDNPATSGRYEVMGIPTFAIFKEGRLAARITGAVPKEQLVSAVERCLN